jgi:hypothetical protein
LEHELSDVPMVRDCPPERADERAQHWQLLKDKLAKVLHFAEAVNDEVHRQNSDEDRALLERAAGQQNEDGEAKSPASI